MPNKINMPNKTETKIMNMNCQDNVKRLWKSTIRGIMGCELSELSQKEDDFIIHNWQEIEKYRENQRSKGKLVYETLLDPSLKQKMEQSGISWQEKAIKVLSAKDEEISNNIGRHLLDALKYFVIKNKLKNLKNKRKKRK